MDTLVNFLVIIYAYTHRLLLFSAWSIGAPFLKKSVFSEEAHYLFKVLRHLYDPEVQEISWKNRGGRDIKIEC